MRYLISGLLLAILALSGCDGGSGPTPLPTPPEEEPEKQPWEVGQVDITIDVGADRASISPYIYGSNQDLPSGNVWTVRRLGGNRLTGYNWERNFSSAGSDYRHYNDRYMLHHLGVPESQWDEPARVMIYWHDESIRQGAESIITVQMAGYLAADDNGTVTEAETAPSARWVKVEPRKNAPFTTTPELSDDVVSIDELVNFLVQQYGQATGPEGIRWYSLDNEPGLWSHTHPRIHPEKVKAKELVRRTVDWASAIKDVDPTAKILGPALYGFGAYLTLQDAPDWGQVQGSYDWFIGYYLDQMHQTEQESGRRLLDVLDVHWYPEARGDHRIVFEEGATTPADIEARLQAPRTLWDPTYTENSWIADCCSQYLPILPRLQQAIETYYPGTKLAITEYDYGAGHTISGGLAQADVLGAFGRYGVDIATRWGIEAEDDYAATAFLLYRNYDGQGGAYGNTSVSAHTSDQAQTSVYAAIEDEDTSRLHVILINKNREEPLKAQFSIESSTVYASGTVWSFDAESAQIVQSHTIEDITDNTFSYEIPPLTAAHIVLR